MNKIITFAIDKTDGLVYSRVGSEMAGPVLQYAQIGEGGKEESTGKVYEKGDFNGPTNYALEKSPVSAFASCWRNFRWTKKVPTELKNRHRKFWGFKLLPVKDVSNPLFAE